MHTLLERVSGYCVTALIVVSLFEAGIILKIRADSALYGSHTRFPTLDSLLQQDHIPETDHPACLLLRVSSDGCTFCRQDKVFYTEIAKRAEAAGCRSFIVGPKAGEVSQFSVPPGTTLLRYVDMAFGEVLYPFMTPQTILLDKQGKILWFREGALDNHALAEGLGAVSKIR